MDDGVIRQELAKCENRRKDIVSRYEREISQLDAEIKVYRNLLRISEGKVMTFAEWLEKFIKDNRFTKTDLGELIGMSSTTIDNWLNGSLPAKRLAGQIGRNLCDIAGNSVTYEDMMSMITGGEKNE